MYNISVTTAWVNAPSKNAVVNNAYIGALALHDMNGIAKLNNGRRRYIRTDEALKGFASWKPQYEK